LSLILILIERVSGFRLAHLYFGLFGDAENAKLILIKVSRITLALCRLPDMAAAQRINGLEGEKVKFLFTLFLSGGFAGV
jgi:hypothetical protein